MILKRIIAIIAFIIPVPVAAGFLRDNDRPEVVNHESIQARVLDSWEVCVGKVPSKYPWYCPWQWCGVTEDYKMYERLLGLSLDTTANRDEIIGLFRLIYVPAVAQMSYSTQQSFQRTLSEITSPRMDKNCIAKFALKQFCHDDWFAGASKLIKVMEVVSSSASFLATLNVEGTMKAMADLIAEKVVSAYKEATGIFMSPSDILKLYSKLFDETNIKYLEGAVVVFCDT